MNARALAVFASAITALASAGYFAHTDPGFKELATAIGIVVLIGIITIGVVVPLTARLLPDPSAPPTPALTGAAPSDTGAQA